MRTVEVHPPPARDRIRVCAVCRCRLEREGNIGGDRRDSRRDPIDDNRRPGRPLGCVETGAGVYEVISARPGYGSPARHRDGSRRILHHIRHRAVSLIKLRAH